MITAEDGDADDAGSRSGRVLAIRDRTEADLDECVRLLAEVHRNDGYPMHWPADPRRWLATPKVFAAWVATLDGHLVGHVALSAISPDDAAPQLLGLTAPGPTADTGGTAGDDDAAGSAGVAMLSRLFVSLSARGYGAGRALMHRAEQAVNERGQLLLLDVHSTNTSAIALYERLGWNFLGTSHAQWGPDRVTLRSYTAPTRRPQALRRAPHAAHPTHRAASQR